MFCPKCGSQNPETGKFCRACGTDLGNVSAVLSGNLPEPVSDTRAGRRLRARGRSDPHEVYGDAIKNLVGGLGFVIVAIALLTTGVAGGRAWWWAMLFPAFGMLSKGVSDYMKSKRMLDSPQAVNQQPQQFMNQPQQPGYSLPPNQTQYVQPESRYKTGDLVPPSVTDGTTRHLEINSEGETMTLPKKP